ncbi:extracellular solute-binding protein [Paenibacillus spongiae]|uniref:Extracellular solute-binding protein n=1 Tax=Paenibacillus spongiae TaxID=2909671 RepID=A0ABY5S0R6_9BACL|nr:extracellular solute-binding protein [Paenibacillus spongiae]UVI27442.1 extracellular solute-binding protein [Paenibacillus spongiae]
MVKFLQSRGKIQIALLILTVMLSGCSGSTSNGNEGQTNAAENSTNDANPVTLDMFYNISWANYPEWGSNRISKLVQDQTGVTLKFSKPTTDDNQQFNLMLASGDLPDFIVNEIQNPTYKKAISSGQFEDLGPLMDKYAPELRERMGDEYWKMNAAPDGKNYAFVSAEMRPSNLDKFLPVGPWNPAPLVRQDIYEAIGKPKLDTPEDLYNVLIEVKQKYPDVMPILIGGTKFDFDSAPGGYQFLIANFGIEKYYEKDGKLYATYKDPNYVQALKWFNKMYTSGLITRGDLTLTSEQKTASKESGKVFYLIDSIGNGYYHPPNNKSVQYVYAPLFTNATILQQGSIGWTGWSIAKSSKHKAEAIKFMSYMLSDEGEKLTHFGEENKDWKMDGDTPVRTDEFLKAMKADTTYATKQGIGPYFFNLDLYDHWIQGGEMKKNPEQREALDLYLPHKNMKFYMLNLLPDADLEEASILQKIKTEFNAAFPTFIMAKGGNEVERLYEEFVQKAESMGMAKVEAVWNKNSEKMRAVFK